MGERNNGTPPRTGFPHILPDRQSRCRHDLRRALPSPVPESPVCSALDCIFWRRGAFQGPCHGGCPEKRLRPRASRPHSYIPRLSRYEGVTSSRAVVPGSSNARQERRRATEQVVRPVLDVGSNPPVGACGRHGQIHHSSMGARQAAVAGVAIWLALATVVPSCRRAPHAPAAARVDWDRASSS